MDQFHIFQYLFQGEPVFFKKPFCSPDQCKKSKRTKKFARLESSFLVGTIMGPMIGGFLFLYSKMLPFYLFAFCGGIAALGIFFSFPNITPKRSLEKIKSKLSYTDRLVFPFLLLASIFSLCQASLLQSIGFFITDIFSNEKDLPLLISLTFVLLSISTVVSQYIFTDLRPISNNKLFIHQYIFKYYYLTKDKFDTHDNYFLLGFTFQLWIWIHMGIITLCYKME